ncbi:MAG: ABC transporter substrate-binding protein [Deltaproteobacteria bacterium]|nr:ABC transporter substrate-binding protein [Deltaproteobacteria bacterium]
MTRDWIRTVFAFLFFFFFLSCASSTLAENIRIGVLLPLTGRLYELGAEVSYKSFIMAVREMNEQGGIGGRKIELIVEDTYGDRDIAITTMEKLITQDNVHLVTGGFSSTVAWAASEVAEEHRVPFLVSTASADRITEAGRHYVFRINTPASEQSKALDTFLGNVARIRSAAILYERSLFGQFWLRKVRRQLEGLGLHVTLAKAFSMDSGDFRVLLSIVKAVDPDLLYMIAHMPEARFIMQQAREVSLNPRLFVGHRVGFAVPEFGVTARGASEFVYSPVIWSPALPYPGAREYYARFTDYYGRPPDYHGAQAYSAMQVIRDALERSKTLEPDEVTKALLETDVMTVLGPVRFRSYGKKSRQNRLPTCLMQWIDSRLRPVWPPGIAVDRYVYPTPKWEEREPRVF